MILSGDTIEARGIITPFSQRTVFEGMSYGKSYAGYDIRIQQNECLRPGRRFGLASTIEYFEMPSNVVGIVHDKSTWARRGLSVFNTVIEPGWRGYLTLELVYNGDGNLAILGGSPIAQVVFHYLDVDSEGYKGKYQDQPDRPVEALIEIN